MKILLIHQNFPGQFKWLAPALVERGHEVRALFFKKPSSPINSEIIQTPYEVARANGQDSHPWLGDFESKIIRGEACFRECLRLKELGYLPDVVLAHPGWGESLFVKEVWPNCVLKVFLEFFYHTAGLDVGFDPEFKNTDAVDAGRVLLKNATNLLQLESVDAAICPTEWQASTFPNHIQEKITVTHDGIDTESLRPSKQARIKLSNGVVLDHEDEVITYVSRSLEPYRGFHIFLRCLPTVLSKRKQAHVLIVGREGVSYGAPHRSGASWKEILKAEVFPQLTDDEKSRIHFLGNVSYDNFKLVLQISSVHVYLTYPFVLSWSLLEAMSMQCPILASNTPPLREVIVDQHNGVLVDFFDTENISKEIIKILSNNEFSDQIGVNARKLMKEQYDLRSICLPRQIDWLLNV